MIPNSLNTIEFTHWLAKELGEGDNSKQVFHLWSAILLVGQLEATNMLERARILHQSEISRTLGGWWFTQLPPKNDRVTFRIRQATRQLMGLEPHSIPEVFIPLIK